ncbi:AAA family ATPase [Neptunomonas marina]|uniref:AAA family ATPase n=1 Tax=Neptunomonas marina TaxID=1815562 RepID=UPI00197DD422|nr:AAA family ATPase [Neptunomonas marina]
MSHARDLIACSLYGESGNGKSWLYKNVLRENNTPFIVANCANASRLNSITQEICNCIVEPGTVRKLGFDEEKAAGISAYFAKADVKHKGSFDIVQEEPLLEAFRLFHSTVPQKKIIVLDNLESILNSEDLMTELADILILLDDSRYAAFNINILIVGIPYGVLQYFRETKNSESVANRINEIDKVSGLDENQVNKIIEKGFSQLEILITTGTLDELAKHVYSVTLGIAQRVHEYCEMLAYAIEENGWKYDPSLLRQADEDWLYQSLRQCYQVVEGHLNSRQTAVARRNQVIYCVAKVSSHQFDSSVIDGLIRKEFPGTIPETNMGIGSILGELSKGSNPLLIYNNSANTYAVRDPRYLMCIKLVLYKDSAHQKVVKRDFSR